MAVKTFATGEILTASDTNTYLNNGGLVYIKSTTFTNTADTGTAFDGVFTSTYDNYRIIADNCTGSTAGTANIFFQFRSAAPANLDTNYFLGGSYTNYTGASGAVALNAAAYWYFTNINNAGAKCGVSMDLQGPNRSAGGSKTGQWATFNIEAWAAYGGQHGTATAAAGFRLYTSAGTFSGNVAVYGYRKA